jgi:hypothetical protein
MSEARPAPNPSAAPQAPLQLLAQRFDRPAAARRTRFLHGFVVQMLAMIQKVVHLPLHHLMALGGVRSDWAFRQRTGKTNLAGGQGAQNAYVSP